MKKTVLFLVVACVSLVGCGGKKNLSENLPQCNDEVVVQKLRDAIIQDFQATCNKGSEWAEYCNAEKGVFDENPRLEDGECVTHFRIKQDEKGWIIGYKTKYENQEAVVTDLDVFAY